jgi:hypothetical protein
MAPGRTHRVIGGRGRARRRPGLLAGLGLSLGLGLGLGAALAQAQVRPAAPDPSQIAPRQQVQTLQGRDTVVSETSKSLERAAAIRPGFDCGGWTSTTVLAIDDLLHDRTAANPIDSILLFDQRFWIKHVRDGKHNLFLRFRKLKYDFESAPGTPVPDVATQEQFDLDLGHIEFSVGSTQVQVGRLFMRTGRGLVLSSALDGFRTTYRSSGGFTLQTQVGTTLHRTDNLDMQVAGFARGHDDRTFFGIQGQYLSGGGVLTRAFALAQVDSTESEDPAQNLIDFRYQSGYFGLDVEGTSDDRRTDYALELVVERGTSSGTAVFPNRATIRAHAATLAIAHRLDGDTVPTFLFDYARGSGDPNRLSVTDGFALGPRAPAGDKNFLYFGRYEGGLALQPRLSNLELFRFGFQLKPLARRIKPPSDFLTGFKLTTYSKVAGAGAISDPVATVPDDDVGHALDVFVAWKALLDVAMLFEYGRFRPGQAYPAGMRGPTEKLAASVTVAY